MDIEFNNQVITTDLLVVESSDTVMAVEVRAAIQSNADIG